jgi:hypothetical protein
MVIYLMAKIILKKIMVKNPRLRRQVMEAYGAVLMNSGNMSKPSRKMFFLTVNGQKDQELFMIFRIGRTAFLLLSAFAGSLPKPIMKI